MKSSINIREAACEAGQVFLPNRYQKSFVDAFEALTGSEVPPMNGRKMKAQSGGRTYWWVRGRDIPNVVEAVSSADPKIKTVGLTGSEWCAEYKLGQPESPIIWDKITENKLGRVALIAPVSCEVQVVRARLERGFYPVQVATAYPNIVWSEGVSGRYNIAPRVVLCGGVEGVAAALGIPAVDLVCREDTVKENDFSIVEELFDVYPTLVRVPSERNQQC